MLRKALFAVALFAFGSSLHASPLPLGTWQTDFFGSTGSTVSGSPFTFNYSFPTVLTVTDIEWPGDQFSVYDNGILLGSTNAVTPIGGDTDCFTADSCLADPLYSHGTFNIGSGPNSISIVAINSPFEGGDVSFRLDSAPVPEPSSLLLMSAGLLGAGIVVKQKVAA